uniref:NADH-ubiquinone oxidoreductase chain 3 n=1 Tax=Parabreviscolex niepini TaxID=2041585 RepID=A0A3G2QVN7_9CEST|nr:NADH dehydrogenase subunit 3 [Parabreviscolex niepini]AYO27341.1 NADH dehydrogenase subunit 3 [Parabreviscolex niepini]
MAWLSVILLVVVCLILAGCAPVFTRYSTPSVAWASPYECGFIPSATSFDSFGFSYFSLLVFFVVFDLEISLLLNMPEQGTVFGGFIYYFVFLVILSLGFLFEAVLGYVHWGY